jgi:hypothetical protein
MAAEVAFTAVFMAGEIHRFPRPHLDPNVA